MDPSEIVTNIVSDFPTVVVERAHRGEEDKVVVDALEAGANAAGTKPMTLETATSELLRAAASPPPAARPVPVVVKEEHRAGAGPDDSVGVTITLAEDYAQLLSTPAKRQQMERMVKEDVADALRAPRTRFLCTNLTRTPGEGAGERWENGERKICGIDTNLTILPSERKGASAGPTPDELAEMLIAQVLLTSKASWRHTHARSDTHTHTHTHTHTQVSDSNSRLRRAMSTRRATIVVKSQVLLPSADGSTPRSAPAAAPMTPLRKVSESDDSVPATPILDKADAEAPWTDGKSIVDRMAIFKQMEQQGGSVPKPQSQVLI